MVVVWYVCNQIECKQNLTAHLSLPIDTIFHKNPSLQTGFSTCVSFSQFLVLMHAIYLASLQFFSERLQLEVNKSERTGQTNDSSQPFKTI